MPRGNPSNLDPVKSKEEATKRGRNGGIKSGEARRAKRSAKETAQLFLNMAAAETVDERLNDLNVKTQDRTNLMGVIARLTILAQSGNINAVRLLMEISGDLQNKMSENNFSVNVGKDDEDNVVIVIPDNGRDNYNADSK